MTNKERYKKYIEEHCSVCKNRDTDLCNIKIWKDKDIIYTRCVYFENETLNYESCMIRKCKTCRDRNKCFGRIKNGIQNK